MSLKNQESFVGMEPSQENKEQEGSYLIDIEASYGV